MHSRNHGTSKKRSNEMRGKQEDVVIMSVGKTGGNEPNPWSKNIVKRKWV